MKILQMVQTLDPSTGGVVQAVVSLSRGLARRGHVVEVVSLDAADSPWLREMELPIHALGSGLTSYRYSKKLLPWLRAYRAEFDCVIVNGLWQYMSFAAWRALAGAGIPYFVFPHGMLDPWFKITFPLKHWKKWLSWPWADYRVLRDANAVVFTSEEERLLARKSFWLYRANEVISPLGVEAPSAASDAKEHFHARHPQLRDTRIFLFLGRLHPKKGCGMLIDALPSAPGWSLVFAGPDQIGWEKELRARVPADLAARVVFTGMLEGELKRGAFQAADAFVLPSHQENFGLSVVEALSFSLPVLISDRVNIWREIATDRAGYVEHDDLEGARRLLERWSATPESARDTMRRNARKCFEQRFEIDRAVESLLTILNG